MTTSQHDRVRKTLTIAASGTTTDAFAAGGYAAYGAIMPAALTGTAISFTVCGTEDGTYVALYKQDNSALTMTVAASRAYPLPAELTAFTFFKIVSNGTEAAARSIVVVAKS